MHIEVVDDCSTKDDPEQVVREIGNNRVSFHRKSKNAGAIPNFNTCIERSRGELVHILHGDDYALPGYYQTIDRLAEAAPSMALYACRSVFVDEKGIYDTVSPRLPSLEQGGHDVTKFIYGTALQFAGVVIRRSFYEKEGGFRTSLVHCADWEMWVRAISLGGGIVSPDALTCYRVFEGNDTSKLVKTGENLKDMIRLGLVLANRDKDYPLMPFLKWLIWLAREQSGKFNSKGDQEAANAASDIAEEIARATGCKGKQMTRIMRSFARRLNAFADMLDQQPN